MLSCEQFEILLADSLDGELRSSAREQDRIAFEQHRASCAACAMLAEDAAGAMAFMERAESAEPPQELYTKILHSTNAGWELKLQAGGWRGRINRFFRPVLQPRFVMGAMMTLMSVTMLSRCAGTPKTTFSAADLDPVRIWASLDLKAHRVWDRTMKGYESMRLVLEIRSQIDEWQQRQAQADEAAADARAEEKKLAPDAAGPGQPRPEEKKK
jgi:hypothetical protein